MLKKDVLREEEVQFQSNGWRDMQEDEKMEER